MNSKKNSCRGNYVRKYDNQKCSVLLTFNRFFSLAASADGGGVAATAFTCRHGATAAIPAVTPGIGANTRIRFYFLTWLRIDVDFFAVWRFDCWSSFLTIILILVWNWHRSVGVSMIGSGHFAHGIWYCLWGDTVFRVAVSETLGKRVTGDFQLSYLEKG